MPKKRKRNPSERQAPADPGEVHRVKPDMDESSTGIPEEGPASLTGERYRAFIEGVNDGVYEVDLQGNFVYFNTALCRTFGYECEEIEGRNYSRFMDEEHTAQVKEAFNRLYRSGAPISGVNWEIIGKNGETRIVEISASLITNKNGEKVGFRGIARDVTERTRARKALKESEYKLQCQYQESHRLAEQYRHLLDFIPYPMVLFEKGGTVDYLNPAFSEVFGWSLEELQGKQIPYVPEFLEKENKESIKKLLKEKLILRYETKRLTKNGKILDTIMRGAVITEDDDEPQGELVFLRDVTQEKRMARNNEALLRISQALPAYPDLEDLLDYISAEIKLLLNVQGALVILLDEEKDELFFLGVAHEDTSSEKRAKKIRYPADKGVSGYVIRTGESVIVPETSKDPHFYSLVDRQIGYPTKDMLDVPLRSSDRIIGVLCALNKKEGAFDQTDVELLNMISSTVALSIENARFSEELKEAYREVMELNSAKDRVINHLSHELKTPISVLSASLSILSKRLSDIPPETWQPTIDRAGRNLQRLLEIQYQVEDIMKGNEPKAHAAMKYLFEQCADELEALVADEIGEGPLIGKIRERIQAIYRPKIMELEEINLGEFVGSRLDLLRGEFEHRKVTISRKLSLERVICLPSEVLRKVVDGLIKNAIENTPDGGKIEVEVKAHGEGTKLVVRDYGVGITEKNQRGIFGGFFTTQETMDYSSKRPFDFNAGGKGADLLRMKIFSEQYNFRITMQSSRCRYIPSDEDTCPGDISRCSSCTSDDDCLKSGGTAFSVSFPPLPEKGCRIEDKVQRAIKS